MGYHEDDARIIQSDDLNQLLENGGYKPFFHRSKESFWSRTVKYIGNLFLTIIQIINIPVFIVGLVTIVEFVIEVWNDEFSLSNYRNNLEWFLYVVAAMFIIKQLSDKTKANMTSAEVDLIWAVNFKKGSISNLFYSIEMEEKYSYGLEKVVKRNLETKISIREQELLESIDELTEVLERVEETSSFPEDVFYSLSRMIDIVTTPISDSQSPRHSFEVTMDTILSQVINLNYFHGRVKQGTIMLKEDGEQYLTIKGQSDISSIVIETKKINIGEKFSGKIIEQGNLIFIDNIYSEEALEYGYGPNINKNKVYNAIMGMPIREKKGEAFETIGVINLHFNDNPRYTENERAQIEKILDVYSHFIVSYLKIREHFK